MEKLTTLDNKVLGDWQKNLRLNYHWESKVPSILAAVLALGTLNHLTPSGYYLAKQQLEVKDLPSLGEELILQGELTKKLTSLICRSNVVYHNNTVISLKSVLIRPGNKPVINNSKAPDATYSYYNCQHWRTFTRAEVNAFATLSGDTNSIHSGENPVVQGMLILLALEDYLASNNLFFRNVDITYLKPVVINYTVKLCKEEKTLYGIVGDSVCFKLNFQEDKKCQKN